MYNVRSEYRRSNWYNGMRFDPSKDNLLSLRNEDDHKDLRAKMAAGVSPRPAHSMTPDGQNPDRTDADSYLSTLAVKLATLKPKSTKTSFG